MLDTEIQILTPGEGIHRGEYRPWTLIVQTDIVWINSNSESKLRVFNVSGLNN